MRIKSCMVPLILVWDALNLFKQASHKYSAISKEMLEQKDFWIIINFAYVYVSSKMWFIPFK